MSSKLTITAARTALRKGEITAEDLAMACMTAMDAAGELNAYVHQTPDIALDQARAADRRLRAGAAPDMCGIPLAIKDVFCTQGVPTQAASRMLQGFVPEYESAVTARLFAAGAVMLGKANLDEFAMGSSTETSVHGPTVNPWRAGDQRLVPGGSSGGSAAAVAADLCLAATGTDTGGSIRQPAAFTGTVGLKPTYGRVSRWGAIPLASSLDQAGPMTKSVRDAAIMLGAMAGHDPRDSTSADLAVPDFEAALSGDIRGKVVGIPREYRIDAMDPAVAALWEQGIAMLRDAGATIRDISLPHAEHALAVYHVLAPGEASSNMARFDGVRFGHRATLTSGDGIDDLYEKTRAEGFGPEVRRRLIAGTFVLSKGRYDDYYDRARKVRALIRRDFDTAFADGVDVMLTPATLTAAFALGAMATADPVRMYLNDIFTVGANLAGLPAVAVPTGLDGAGLPLGLQLIGRPWDEGGLLNHAHVLETAAGFVSKPDKWW